MRYYKYLALYCIFFLVFVSCKKEKKVFLPSPSLTKTVLTSSKGGRKIWKLTSERIKIENKKTHLHQVKFELFKDEKIECTITGDKGEIDGDRITLSGNIILTTEEGATLITSSLLFSEKTHSISTDSEVSFIKDGLVLKGNGLIADFFLTDIKIKKDVEVFFRNK